MGELSVGEFSVEENSPGGEFSMAENSTWRNSPGGNSSGGILRGESSANLLKYITRWGGEEAQAVLSGKKIRYIFFY